MAKRKTKPKPRKKRRKPAKPRLSAAVRALRDGFVEQLGGVRQEDMVALELLCQAIVLQRRAFAEAEAGGTVVKHTTGVTSISQSLRAACELRRMVADGLARFGLSPLDRAAADKAGASLPVAPPSAVSDRQREEEDFEKLLRSRPPTIPLRDRGIG